MKTMNKCLRSIIVLLLFCIVSMSSVLSVKAVAEPETWTFEATESAYVSSAHTQTNYSTYTYLSVKNQFGDENMALMKFDISSILAISGHPTVENASLSLYTLNPSVTCTGAPTQFKVHRLSSNWAEGNVNKSTMPLSNVESTGPASNCPAQAEYQSFSAFEVARALVEERLPNYGIAFAGFPYLTGDWRRSFSSSRGTYKPRLYITFADYVSPSFTSARADSITKNSAKITWSTDEPTATKVDWGTSTAYGSSQSLPSETHEFTLSSLAPATTYHFRLTAYDHFQNTKTSGDYSFTTLAESTATSAQSSATAVSAKDATKTVDASIAVPNVKYVSVGDKRTDAPFNDVISMFTTEDLIIGGDSFPSAKIVVIIGEQAFSTDADNTGIWEIKISAKDFETTKYEVTAQAQDTQKNKGSGIKKIFDLSVEQTITAPEEKMEAEKSGLKNYFGLSKTALFNIGGAILLIFLLGTLVLLHLRKKKIANHASRPDAAPDKSKN